MMRKLKFIMEKHMKDVVEQQKVNGDIIESPNYDLILDNKVSREDLKTYGLKAEDVKDIIEIKNKFTDVSTLAVAEYGKDLSNESNKCTSELLSLVKNSELDETGAKLNQVLSVAQTINSSNLISSSSGLAKLPIIGSLFKNAKSAKQKFEMRFADTKTQIDNLVTEIETNQGGLKHRVNMLDTMFNAVTMDYRELGLYIVAGKVRYAELQEEIKRLSEADPLKEDLNYYIRDLNQKSVE
jgi:uncharacterized protein YaaN involved in tellurite resistance